MKPHQLASCVLLGALTAACTSSTPDAATAADIRTYRGLVDEVAAAAGDYQMAMMAASMSTTACPGVHDQYDRRVRPIVVRMVDMAGSMDAFMGMHHGDGHEDMGCVAMALLDELDRHQRVACTSAGMDDDRSEAIHHVAAMTGYDDHAGLRCDEMLAGMNGHGWSWADMMGGCGMPSGSDCGMMGCGSGVDSLTR